MTDGPDDHNSPESEELIELIRAIRSDVKAAQRQHVQTGQQLGYIFYAAGEFTTHYEAVSRLPQNTDVMDAMKGGITIGKQLQQRIGIIRKGVDVTADETKSALPLFLTAAVTGHSMSNSFAIPSGCQSIEFYPLDRETGTDAFAGKLEKFDPSLGSIYRDAWTALHTHPDDPGRAALWQMRHAFDVFFALLAPDIEVRGTEHWVRKEGPNPLQVHREERIRYAAHQWVSDASLRTVLLESAQETLRVYRRLHRAHERQTLDFSVARDAFMAADEIIRRWVDSIDDWPPSHGA